MKNNMRSHKQSVIIILFALLLGSCSSSSELPYQQVTVSTDTEGPASTPEPLPDSNIQNGEHVSQEVALLLGARSDLAALSGLTHYDVDLSVDYSGAAFQGNSRVDYTNTEDVPLDSLYFRLLPNGGGSYGDGFLEVSKTIVEGEMAKTNLSLNDTVLEVVLPNEIDPGENIQIEMEFSGEIPRDFGGGEEPIGFGIYNLSDGVLALSGWYPILAVYDDHGWNLDPVSPIGDSVTSDTALYSLNLTVDDDLVVAATGLEVDSKQMNGDVQYRYASGPVRDFFIVMSTDYESLTTDVDGVLVKSYYLPGHEDAGREALSIAADSLKIFNQRFGPYPYTELDVMDAPMHLALGVEYPGIVLVASSLYDDTSDPSFSVATAHEVAHQWWYNVVGNHVYQEPWVDEALTTYSSSLYYQEVLGQRAYQGFVEYWQDRYDRLVEVGDDDLVTESLQYFMSPDNSRKYGGVVYTKGALFFKALREEIGDEAFFGALKNYYQDHKYQIARGADLLDTFETATGRSLEDFYQVWLYSPE